MKIIFVVLYLLIAQNLYGAKGSVTSLDIPRFVSLKSNDVNLRVGPSVNYPIEIKYLQKNLPVEIIDEFDVWRKIKDYQNNIGWLHKSLVKGDRFILTGVGLKNSVNVYNRPNGKLIGIIEKNNILSLSSCLVNWCSVYNNEIKGWLTKDNIWGVYKEETYNQSYFQAFINQYWKILDSNWFK